MVFLAGEPRLDGIPSEGFVTQSLTCRASFLSALSVILTHTRARSHCKNVAEIVSKFVTSLYELVSVVGEF